MTIMMFQMNLKKMNNGTLLLVLATLKILNKGYEVLAKQLQETIELLTEYSSLIYEKELTKNNESNN